MLPGQRPVRRLPRLRHHLAVRHVTIIDGEPIPRKGQVREPVISHGDGFVEVVRSVVVEHHRPRRKIPGRIEQHRHTAVTEAAAIGLEPPMESVLAVDRHPMLVPPEPQHGPVEDVPQLFRRRRVLLVKDRDVLVMAQEDHASMVDQRFHLLPDPSDERSRQPTIRRVEDLKPRNPDRVVPGIKRDDEPVLVAQAEKTGPLSCGGAPRGTAASPHREEHVEIAVPQRVHLVVPVQREGPD